MRRFLLQGLQLARTGAARQATLSAARCVYVCRQGVVLCCVCSGKTYASLCSSKQHCSSSCGRGTTCLLTHTCLVAAVTAKQAQRQPLAEASAQWILIKQQRMSECMYGMMLQV